jgi:hypothetical protein
VQVVNGDAVLGAATVNPDTGTWQVDVELTEPDTLVLRARTVDESGAVLAHSEPVTLVVASSIAPETGAAEWSATEVARVVGILLVALLALVGMTLLLVGGTLRSAVQDGLAGLFKFRPPRSRDG